MTAAASTRQMQSSRDHHVTMSTTAASQDRGTCRSLSARSHWAQANAVSSTHVLIGPDYVPQAQANAVNLSICLLLPEKPNIGMPCNWNAAMWGHGGVPRPAAYASGPSSLMNSFPIRMEGVWACDGQARCSCSLQGSHKAPISSKAMLSGI